MPIKNALVAATLVACLMAGSAAYAASSDDSAEIGAATAATITASEAIKTVESQSDGKVVELTLVADTSAPIYQVTVLKPDGTEANFTVDAKSGTATAAQDAGDSDNGATDAEDNDNGGSDAAGDE